MTQARSSACRTKSQRRGDQWCPRTQAASAVIQTTGFGVFNTTSEAVVSERRLSYYHTRTVAVREAGPAGESTSRWGGSWLSLGHTDQVHKAHEQG